MFPLAAVFKYTTQIKKNHKHCTICM